MVVVSELHEIFFLLQSHCYLEDRSKNYGFQEGQHLLKFRFGLDSCHTHTNDYCFLDTHSAHTIGPSALPACRNKRDFDSDYF